MKERPDEEKKQEKHDAPAPDIPDLKKREKERKKAGAAWGGGRPLGGPFAGATGGAGTAGIEAVVGEGRIAAAAAQSGVGAAESEAVARAGAAAVAGTAAVLPAGLGWLGQASASYLGKILIGIGLASVLAGVGLYTYMRLHEKPALPPGELAPISDSIQMRHGQNDARLRMAAQAGHGQFKFDDKTPPAAETPAAAEKSQTQAPETPAENPWGDILSATQGPRDSGQPWGSAPNSGGQNLLSMQTGSGTHNSAGRIPRYPGQKGRLSKALEHGASHSNQTSPMRTRNIRSGRAFAQLRYARGMSVLAARGSSEQGMRMTALTAFEQADTQGGQISPIDSAVPVNPSASGGEYGGTAPLLGDPNALPDEQPSPPGAVDPAQAQNYQNPMNGIKGLGASAGMLKLLAVLLIAIGIILIIIGACLIAIGSAMFLGTGIPLIIAGIALIIMGAMLIAMAIMMLMAAQKMAAQAKAAAAALESAYGQDYEKQNVDSCVQQAVDNGTSPDACQSPNPTPHYTDSATDASNVQKSVKDERGANAEYDDGTPVFQKK